MGKVCTLHRGPGLAGIQALHRGHRGTVTWNAATKMFAVDVTQANGVATVGLK